MLSIIPSLKHMLLRLWSALLLPALILHCPVTSAQEPSRSGTEARELGKLLNSNEVVLVFRERGPMIELVMVGPERDQTTPLSASIDDIKKALAQLDSNIGAAREAGPSPPFDLDASRMLASSLSLQVLRQFPPRTTLVFVPEVELLKAIPFHILALDKNLLAQNYDIAVSPSVEVLRTTLRRRRAPLAALIGTPTFSDKLGAAIARNSHLRMPYVTVFSENATEAFVKEKLPYAHLVLLAPHGHFNGADPSRSLRSFRKSDSDDGYLHAHEISALALKPGLIFVNSCDLGRQLAFPDVLLKAGASTVVASYWQPTLKGPSSWIVARVMKHISEGGTAAFADSQAQREMLAQTQRGGSSPQYNHPAFWAPFVAIGNWR
jgi:hypothetical protein